MNTMDYRRVSECWQAWLGVSTGTLHGQLTQSAAVLTQQFQQQKLITSGTITKAEVDDVAVGRVSAIDLPPGQWTANVTMRINGS